MNNTEFMLIKMGNENNFIFDEEDEKIFEKAIAGESPYSIYSTGILQDDNLLFKATKVLRPYKNEGITLIINGGPIAGLVVVINVCHMLGIHLSLAYYNTKTGEFDLQQVMCMKVCMKESYKEISKGMEEVETQNTKEISKGMEEVETQNTVESFNEKYKKEFDDTFKGYGDKFYENKFMKFALERNIIGLMSDGLLGSRSIYDRKDEMDFLEANQEEEETFRRNLIKKATKVLKPYVGKKIFLAVKNGDFTPGLIAVINTCYMFSIGLSIVTYTDKINGMNCLQQVM